MILVGLVNGRFTTSCELISSLNQYYHFDLNIYLSLDVNVNVLRFEGIEDITVLRTIITSDNDEIAKFTKYGNNIFLIVTIKSRTLNGSDETVNAIKKLFQANIKMKIGIFYDMMVSPNLKEISNLLLWCWRDHIINVFVTYFTQINNLHTFTFHPYASFKLINLTDDLSPENYFKSKIENLQGHPIRTYLSLEYQTAFLIKNNTSLGGPYGKLFCLIIEKMNATLSVPLQKILPYDAQKVKELIFDNKTFDINPQPAKIQTSLTYLDTIQIEKLNILVPQSKPYNIIKALFLKVLLKDYDCLVLLMSILFIVGSIIVIRFVLSGKFVFIKSFIQTLALLITANTYINYRKFTKSETLILVPCTFAGIVITNIIFSVLFSFLTVTVFEPELDTFEDIDRFGCNIHTPGRGIAEKVRVTIGEKLFQKVSVHNPEVLKQNLANYDISNCYLFTDSRIRVVLERQKRFSIKGFHIPKQYASKVPYSFLIRPDLPYVDKMNYIILRSFDSGLFEKWLSDSYYELVQMNYFQKISKSAEEETNNYELLYFLVLGWFLAAVCFICEFLYFRISKIVG